MVLVVINAVPGDLQYHAVSLRPTSWRWTHDGCGIDEPCPDRLRWDRQRHWRESALEFLWICVVGELVACDVDLVSALHWAHVWLNACHDGLLVVRILKACIAPVDAVETHVKWEPGSDVCICW